MAQSLEPAMKQMTAPPREEIAAIVGAANIRSATQADQVDGVLPGIVVEPGTQEELGKVLACAGRAGLAVIPRGSGTKIGWGNPPRRADLVLSTARLNGILEHAWGDMTATVQAGCKVAQFQRTLAEHGQRLALDPLWPERATIGGILATNDSGALRARFGSLRDLIIGVTLALADGTLARSGGKVVKNVAGYDLPKLAAGSLGTLGVIAEAVFRLHPLPHEARSLDVAFEGTRAGLDAQEKQLRQLAEKAAPKDPANCWNAREALWNEGDAKVVAAFSVLPTQIAEFCAALESAGAAQKLTWKVVAQAIGVGQLSLGVSSEDALMAALEGLRANAETLGGTLVALRCSHALKSRFNIWGAPSDSVALMRQVKAQLDPGQVLSPGRFVGGI